MINIDTDFEELMMSKIPRRVFLQASAAVAAGSSSVASAQEASIQASERLRVGIIGAGGRALSLIRSFSSNPSAEIVGIADLDANRLPHGLSEAESIQSTRPRGETDFRRLIDDDSIDAIVIGTPDHWHAIPTILACQAGKDVYVEKPDGHNIEEGRRMVAAMRKHDRIVQMGSQHRSTLRMHSAIEFIKSGKLGRCVVAKAWESTKQGEIARVPDSQPPSGVDYDMWLGPAPKRPFNSKRFHSNWRWFYDYGCGDLGNDGVHRLDMAIAMLNAACDTQGDQPIGMPNRISAHGGKWYFDDAQEFPDTMQVTYEYAAGPQTKILTYEMRLWAPYNYLGKSEGAAVFGDQGYIVMGNRGWTAHSRGGELLASGEGDSHEAPHVQNFIDCIKSREKPYCDLETVGHPASVLCHAGNIAARVGRILQFDPASETFADDDQANGLRTRAEYRKPWVLPQV
jgi:predicted dehydrogenase